MSRLPRLSLLWFLLASIPTGALAWEGAAGGEELNLLSRDPAWLKLIHYERSGKRGSGYLSAIASEEFFLHPQGGDDPRAELERTLAEIQRPLAEFPDVNRHPRCRFPARTLWLQSRLPELKGVPPLSLCREFIDWSRWEHTDSISVVFVTGYLGNPASFYGHLLLKMNSGPLRGTTRLIDVTVNYGALIPPDENPVAYILKGLTGGYDAGFSHIDYYYHDHNYGETELRDMWEYELALDPQDARFVIAHAWEVLGKRYTYYFLRRNCAYRIGELVEIVDGLEVIPRNPVYVMPQSLVKKMTESSYRGGSLVRTVRFHPSRQTRFYGRFRQLEGDESEVLARLVADPALLDGTSLAERPLSSRYRILDAALDYYQYVRRGGDLEEGVERSLDLAYQAVLRARYRLPPGESSPSEESLPSPEKGRPPGYASLGGVYGEVLGSQLSFRLRPVYYDALDGGPGHVSRSALSMGDLEARVGEEGLFLDRLDLFHVRSVNDRYSGLPGDSGFAWSIRLGMERPEVGCGRCAVARAQGEIGTSRRLGGEGLLGTWSVGGAVQESRRGFGKLSVRTALRGDLALPASMRMVVEYGVRRYLDGERTIQHTVAATLRYPITSRLDARLAAIEDGSRELGVSLGFYW